MAAKFHISLDEAVQPLVLALDVGSSATRGMVYDAHGRPVGKRAKVAHHFTGDADGTSVIDPDQVVDEVVQVIDKLVSRMGEAPIAGMAIDTFASSFIATDAQGRAITDCHTYADARPGPQVEQLRRELDEDELQQRTGVRLHASYWPARLRWFAENEPEVLEAASHFVTLGDYVWLRLIGTLGTGTSNASWTGLVNRHTALWDEDLLARVTDRVTIDQLPPIHRPREPLTVTPDKLEAVTGRWPTVAHANWYGALTDGFAANVGLGAHDETAIGASCATSGALRVVVREQPETLPRGLWCYRVGRNHSLIGGALNDVGRAMTWADENFRVDDPEALAAVLAAEPSPYTPLVLPFFTGERSTGWASDARAVMENVTAATTPALMYRGVLEGIALAYARIATQLRVAASTPENLYAGGRVAGDHPGLMQLLADAMDTPVTPVTIKRTTLHGTALMALQSTAPGVTRTMPDQNAPVHPVPSRRAYYEERLARFERLYEAAIGTRPPTQADAPAVAAVASG